MPEIMSKLYTGLLSLLCVFLVCSCNPSGAPLKDSFVNIIPEPKSVELGKGWFEFNQKTKIIVPDSLRTVAEILTSKFKTAAGWDLEITSEKPESNYLVFMFEEDLGKESYRLESNENFVEITASALPGFVYGIQSLRQLLPVEIEHKSVQQIKWEIPQVSIEDSPRYEWRGSHLDVARHFFKKEYIKKHLDRMAFLKLNTFHFHLVDDQGWRIEIKKYPKLTEVGGFRVDQEDKHWNARIENDPNVQATYGGFYTQEDIKEIVAYAQERGIRVIPEIEMPAHVMSAIAAYPWLSCKEEPITVPSGGVWPITEIYCAGKESTFEFLENVLLEIMELFPSEYIHVGGDEATKTNWEKCPHCQRRMKEEDLANVEELQSYFIKRMERFIRSHNKVLIGWDEILEGGLAPGATVMSWRGVQGGWEASKQGHDVVMTPGSHMYFDHYQGDPDIEPVAFGGYTTLSKVYEFDPVVDSMTVEQKQHVLGGQANLWSEFISDPDHSEYMLFPRLVALSEVVWSSKEKQDWKGFSEKLKQNILPRFDAMDINYSKSAYAVTAKTEVDLDSKNLRIKLESEFPESEIRYALNDEALNERSKVYSQPIEFNETATIKAAVFENGQQPGAILKKTFSFHKAVGKEVSYKPVYHNSYKGPEDIGLVNVLRGSLNFHDGQWQGWLVEDVDITINLEEITEINSVSVGAMENQGSGIYYPLEVAVFVSENGEDYRSVGRVSRKFSENGNPELMDFNIVLEEPVNVRFIQVKVDNLGHPPRGGDAWLFLDEVVVE